MDDNFLNKIKENKEYPLGKYEQGRNAWILEDIQPINPIKAKGMLQIWNYNQ